ncbi:hypothetical protein [Massilia sp. YIM B04103]|uniref:hypothetical protein n=1 Tax=Massilia sp. YIM B04103 TaxID=2963106 RepID=UPI0021089737|nr:hypothetical protein [Massilia sp. YIM B04103]
MQADIRLIQRDDGRWEWILVPANNNSLAQGIVVSAITFKSRADAKIDAEQHVAAVVGKDGRTVRSEEELRHLIQLVASECFECQDTFFGDIYWHERDEMGCNWSMSTVSGQDWSACLDYLQPVAIRLRQTYNIPDKG